MKLEFRMAISPAPSFYSTILLAALSLRRLGSAYEEARISVSVGDCAELEAVQAENRWSEDFPVEWRMVPAERFRRYSYYATGNDRYAEPSDADVIILCDSDICLVDRIDDLAERLSTPERRAVAGLQAHSSPFRQSGAGSETEWRRVFAAAGLPCPELNVRYSVDRSDAQGLAPPYFNYGLVAFSRAAFAAARVIDDDYCRVAREMTDNSFFQAQIGLSLTIAAANLDVEMLPHAFNCANDERPFAAPPEVRLRDIGDIRAIHFLRGDQFDRRTFLSDKAAYMEFLAKDDLNPVNQRFRDHVVGLGKAVEFFLR